MTQFKLIKVQSPGTIGPSWLRILTQCEQEYVFVGFILRVGQRLPQEHVDLQPISLATLAERISTLSELL